VSPAASPGLRCCRALPPRLRATATLEESDKNFKEADETPYGFRNRHPEIACPWEVSTSQEPPPLVSRLRRNRDHQEPGARPGTSCDSTCAASGCSFRSSRAACPGRCRAAAVVALLGERVGAPVGRVRPGCVRDLRQARAVGVNGEDLPVDVVVVAPHECDLGPVGRPGWFVAT